MTTFALRINGQLGGSLPWSTGFLATSGGVESAVSATFNAAAVNLFQTAVNGLNNFMNADVTTQNTTVSTLNPVTFKQTTKTTANLAEAGTDANPSLPWNIAEVITLRSNQFNKSGHGRMFLPPFAEDQVTAHKIKGATTASMKIVFDAFWAALVAGGVQPIVMNRRALTDGTPPFTQKNLITYDIPDKPAQQRRRVSKVVPTRVSGPV